jgi:hypothetical protein
MPSLAGPIFTHDVMERRLPTVCPTFSAWGMVLYTFTTDKNSVKIPVVIINRYV